MLERILIAGSGGQGIILIGRILATAAMESCKHLTFFPSYGAEVRGGTSHCHIILSDNEIASPIPEKFDSLILMNQDSYNLFAIQAEADALTIVNSSLCQTDHRQRKITGIAATEMADIIGDTRIANFIMLGAYLAHKKTVPISPIEKAIAHIFKGKGKKILDLNMQAFRTGLTTT